MPAAHYLTPLNRSALSISVATYIAKVNTAIQVNHSGCTVFHDYQMLALISFAVQFSTRSILKRLTEKRAVLDITINNAT